MSLVLFLREDKTYPKSHPSNPLTRFMLRMILIACSECILAE